MEFEKKYVHFMWDDELEGKLVFLDDNIDDLIDDVKYNDTRFIVRKNKDDDCNVYPFQDTLYESNYIFCYYDPNYDYKRAYAKGKKIEFKLNDTWCPAESPTWDDGIEYRIKEDEEENESDLFLTYHELSKWLAQGNGEVMINELYIQNSWTYEPRESTVRVLDKNIKVKKWNDNAWHEPTYKYCYGDK